MNINILETPANLIKKPLPKQNIKNEPIPKVNKALIGISLKTLSLLSFLFLIPTYSDRVDNFSKYLGAIFLSANFLSNLDLENIEINIVENIQTSANAVTKNLVPFPKETLKHSENGLTLPPAFFNPKIETIDIATIAYKTVETDTDETIAFGISSPF